MKNKHLFIVLAIIILAGVLRFHKLGSTPPSLYWDETSLGYNAYSILKTAKDEHGEFLPLARFIAFGDYKPPGYIYAIVPSIAIFGLNEFAIRFPSALAGTLTVLVTYFLVAELFSHENSKFEIRNSKLLPAIAAGLLAVSPWHLHFSRGAFEANLATFFSVSGIYLFLKGMKEGKYLVISITFFVLSMYTFNTHRVFVPLLLFGLVIIYHSTRKPRHLMAGMNGSLLGAFGTWFQSHYWEKPRPLRPGRLHWKEWLKQKKWAITALILGLVLISPQMPFLLSREGRLRFDEVTFFKNLDPIIIANERIAREGNAWWARLIHNRRVQFALEFAKHYSDHFRADFLFFSGDINPRLGTRDQGLLYPIELTLILAGTYFLIKKKHPAALILFFWWLVGIVPAATARETPHALRTLNILPVPQIIAAIGIISLYQIIKKKRLFIFLLLTSYSLLLFSYLHTYFVHYPRQWAFSWQYGYKQMTSVVSDIQDRYDRIFITNKYGRPYIYLLFYQKYPPQQFWQTRDAERDWYGFWTVKGYDKFRFGPFPGSATRKNEKWLVVAASNELPKEASTITNIAFPSGETAFEIGEIE